MASAGAACCWLWGYCCGHTGWNFKKPDDGGRRDVWTAQLLLSGAIEFGPT